MEWENNKITKVVLKSTLGGNCRLRVPNAMITDDGNVITPAKGLNSNTFYRTETIPAPLISEKAKLNKPVIPETVVYDIKTIAGKLYTLRIK
jgi:alpha-L-fucosidase 2